MNVSKENYARFIVICFPTIYFLQELLDLKFDGVLSSHKILGTVCIYVLAGVLAGLLNSKQTTANLNIKKIDVFQGVLIFQLGILILLHLKFF